MKIYHVNGQDDNKLIDTYIYISAKSARSAIKKADKEKISAYEAFSLTKKEANKVIKEVEYNAKKQEVLLENYNINLINELILEKEDLSKFNKRVLKDLIKEYKKIIKQFKLLNLDYSRHKKNIESTKYMYF